MVLVVLSTLSIFGSVAAQVTIDFSGITSPSSTHVAKYDIDDATKESDPTIGTEFTTAMYGAISSSDDTYAVTRVQHTYDYAQQIFRFLVFGPIKDFNLTWEGNIAFMDPTGTHSKGIEIWNTATNSWEYFGTVSQVGWMDGAPDPPSAGASVLDKKTWMADDETISKTYSANIGDYIDNGYITLMVWGKNSHDATVSTDYVKLDFTGPVGGVWVPINKFNLLAPWIGLASLLITSVAGVSIVYVKRRKNQRD